jgi:hypothetical protein
MINQGFSFGKVSPSLGPTDLREIETRLEGTWSTEAADRSGGVRD